MPEILGLITGDNLNEKIKIELKEYEEKSESLELKNMINNHLKSVNPTPSPEGSFLSDILSTLHKQITK